jgi:hypothetical protein
MSATTRTSEEEDEFMATLLGDDFFTALPSPDPVRISSPLITTPRVNQSPLLTPTRHITKSHSSPSVQAAISSKRPKSYTTADVDVQQMTTGLDWDDFSDYVPTPQKPSHQNQVEEVLHKHTRNFHTAIPRKMSSCRARRRTGVRSPALAAS